MKLNLTETQKEQLSIALDGLIEDMREASFEDVNLSEYFTCSDSFFNNLDGIRSRIYDEVDTEIVEEVDEAFVKLATGFEDYVDSCEEVCDALGIFRNQIKNCFGIEID